MSSHFHLGILNQCKSRFIDFRYFPEFRAGTPKKSGDFEHVQEGLLFLIWQV